MTEAHHAAVAQDQVEARRRDRQDQDPGEQSQHELVAARPGVDRQQHQPGGDEDGEGGAGVQRDFHLPTTGNSPCGRSASTIAIKT